MDVQQLVVNVLAFLGPTLPLWKKAAETAAGELGKGTVQKTGALVGKLREWFRHDNNTAAEQTLDLYTGQPDVFAGALSTFLLQTLQQHPDWAAEIKTVLNDGGVQEIIARNKATVEQVVMKNTSGGTQRIDSDNSIVRVIHMEQ